MSLDNMKKQIDKFNEIRDFAEFECGEIRFAAQHAADAKISQDKILELSRKEEEYNELSIAGSNPTGAVRKKDDRKILPPSREGSARCKNKSKV